MHGIIGIVIIVSLLTLIGSLALGVFAYRYYWGIRGTPPATGEARRLQKEEELRRRALQIEYAEKHPIKPRRPVFWDNRKA
jgi:hypothetical protein